MKVKGGSVNFSHFPRRNRLHGRFIHWSEKKTGGRYGKRASAAVGNAAATGNRIGKKEKNEDFYKAILLLKDEEECYSFFRDMCTIAELRAMEQRFEVARMLTQGKVYSEILERTGASSATISRVARSLTDSDGGYERIFARMKGEK